MGGRATGDRRGTSRVFTLASLLATGAVVGAFSSPLRCGYYNWPVRSQDWRFPCDGSADLSPSAVLYVHWFHAWADPSGEPWVDLDAPGFHDSIRLVGPDEREVPLLWSLRRSGLLVLCPLGGLAPDSTYRWELDAVESSDNHVGSPSNDTWGAWHLDTGPADGLPVILDQAACDALGVPEELLDAAELDCDPCQWDTGLGGCPGPPDTDEPEDSDEPADSTPDSGDSGTDSGDTGAADDTADSAVDQAP